MYTRALNYATEMHKGQVRNDPQSTPYIEHPKRVAQRRVRTHASGSTKVINYGVSDDNVLCAALLHDTLEDTAATETSLNENLNTRVTEIVKQVTSDNSMIEQLANEQFSKQENNASPETAWIVEQLRHWMPQVADKVVRKRQGKALYLTKKLNQIDLDAVLVKLSDRIDNLMDIPEPKDEDQLKPDSNFLIEYYVESKYMLDHLDRSRFEVNSVHEKLIKDLEQVLQERYDQIMKILPCIQPVNS